MKPDLFVDLDGVLADFDSGFERCFGVRPNQDNYEPPGMWDMVRAHGKFYRELPPFPDVMKFWNSLRLHHLHPVILTGIPSSIPNVAAQKVAWVKEHIGDVPVICCYSKDKHKHGRPGDILIDDRLKYSKYWLKMGGLFIHHTSQSETLLTVEACYRVANSRA